MSPQAFGFKISNAFALNSKGEGYWLNSELSITMREIIKKLQLLDNTIGTALTSIADRRASLYRDAQSVACARDTNFSELHASVERWL